MLADNQSIIIMILLNTGYLVFRLSPWVLGGILLGALVATFVPKEKSFSFLKGRKGMAMLPIASLLGTVSPACTYGTVPIFVEAIKRGASIGPAVAFLVASSLVNPQMSVLAAGALGWKMAALQIAVAIVAAVIVGVIVDRASAKGIPIISGDLISAMKPDDETQNEKMEHEPHKSHNHHHGHHKHSHSHSGQQQSSLKRFLTQFVNLFEFVGFYFIIGALIASALPFVINTSKLMVLLGRGHWYAVPLGALASVPTYMCGGGMIPFLAEGSKGGMHHGAILAFLIAGPATRITPLAALSVMLKKRYVALYVVFVVLLSMAVGLLLAPWI